MPLNFMKAIKALALTVSLFFSVDNSAAAPKPACYYELRGTVRNAVSSAVLKNVLVSLQNTRLRAKSDKRGSFRISKISPGDYNLLGELSGYLPYSQSLSLPASACPKSKSKSPKTKIVGVTILLSPVSAGSEHTFYVAPDGNNSNNGSAAAPWATPGYASKQLHPGDTLIIRAGTYLMSEYYDDMITTEVSGTADAWITIRGEDGARPAIKGRNNLLAAVELTGRSYVRIENLDFSSLIDSPYSGGMREGVDVGGSGGDNSVSHIVLKDISVHHVEEAGINLAGDSDDIVLHNLHVHHTAGPAVSAPDGEHGGLKNIQLSNSILEYAGLFSNGAEVQSGWDRPDGFGIEESDGPITITDVISRYNFGDGLDSKSKNTTIRRCLVANNYGDGIKLWGGGSIVENSIVYGTGYPLPDEETPWSLLVIDADEPGASFALINNTFFDDARRPNPNQYAALIQYDQRDVPIDLHLQNNIFAGLGRLILGGAVNLHAVNNLFFNRTDSDQVQLEFIDGALYLNNNVGSLGSGNIYGDPRFANPSWGPSGSFYLLPNSPARNSGMTVGAPTSDFNLQPRPQGSAADIGAYEFSE